MWNVGEAKEEQEAEALLINLARMKVPILSDLAIIYILF